MRRGLLFAGTELGVFVSFDDGDDWQSLQLNLPPASMRDLAVHGDDLIVATHGRGFWVLDNITVLRQINETVAQSNAFLFKPADVVSIPPPNENGTPQPKDEPFAENPPYRSDDRLLPEIGRRRADQPGNPRCHGPDRPALLERRQDPPPNPNSLNVAAVWVADAGAAIGRGGHTSLGMGSSIQCRRRRGAARRNGRSGRRRTARRRWRSGSPAADSEAEAEGRRSNPALTP